MVSCHRINNGTNSVADKPVVLVTVLWENEVNGSLVQINLDSEHSKHSFKNASVDSFELEASIAPKFNHLGVSVGIGPYSRRIR